ncbi:hypothetical protein Ancab_038052, partial [Ancistrocladus abbreviatus]
HTFTLWNSFNPPYGRLQENPRTHVLSLLPLCVSLLIFIVLSFLGTFVALIQRKIDLGAYFGSLNLMGITTEDEGREERESGVLVNGDHRHQEDKWQHWKACIACLISFLVSMAGVAILVWWQIDYHPTNSELWMVPIGLILFATPVIVWLSSIFSDFCCPPRQEDRDSRGLGLSQLTAGSAVL